MTLVIIVTLVLAFHIAIIYALATKHFNPMYLVAATFAFLSPVSTASLLYNEPYKIARVYSTMLIVVLGIFVYRLLRLGPITWLFIAFIAYYCLAAIWSEFPASGVLYKGLFGAVFLSGVFLAYSTSNLHELRTGLRILALAGAAFAVFILLELVRNPDALTNVGRLMAFGINPNFIGQTAAGLFIITCFLALYDQARAWKIYGYIVSGTLLVIILYTGSRGSFGMAMIGAGVMGLPLTRRPGFFIFMGVLLFAVMYFGLGLVAEHARERLFNIPEDVRAGTRAAAMEDFAGAPVFGQGWVFNVGADGSASTRNAHNIYLQVLAELGTVGITMFAVIFAFLWFKAYEAWRYVRHSHMGAPLGYLMVGVLLALFAHGAVESSTMVGTTVNAILLGFGVALIDRLPELVWQHEEEQALVEAPALATHIDDVYLPAPYS